MSKIQPLFTWRSAISSAAGPENSTTRHVLLSISLYMSEKGDGAFPSMERLAVDTGLSVRSIKKHVKLAEETEWLKVVKKSGRGRSWKRNDYKASIPESYHKKVKELQSEAVKEIHHEGGAGGSPQSNKVVNLVPRGGASKRNKVVQEVHPNTTYNSSKNSPEARARVNGVVVPKNLSSVDGFGKMYEDYCRYMKDTRNSWPHSLTTEQDFHLLAELQKKGNDPVKVIRQTIQTRNKTFFALRRFDRDDQEQTSGAKQIKEFNAEEYLASN